jgi:hypothetical protein
VGVQVLFRNVPASDTAPSHDGIGTHPLGSVKRHTTQTFLSLVRASVGVGS